MSHSAVAAVRRRRFPVLVPTLAVLLGLLVSGCGINNIPTYEEQAKAKWSEVENQYQRRSDLIPNLVETVKGFAKQEREVLEAVTAARSRATSIQATPDLVNNPEAFKKFQEAQLQLTGALSRLLAVSERYPDPQVEPEFPRPAGAARGHREPHRGGAARLHRGGAGLQHRDQNLSGHLLEEAALRQQQADAGVRRRRRRQAQPASQVLMASSDVSL